MRSSVISAPSMVIDVRSRGAKLDARRIRGATASVVGGVTQVDCTAGVPTPTFTAADVGKIAVPYTDTAAGTISTIGAVVSSTVVQLSINTGITGTVYLNYGSSGDGAAINQAITDAQAYTVVDTTVGPNQDQALGYSTVWVPPTLTGSMWMLDQQVTVPGGVRLITHSMAVNVLSDRYAPAIVGNPASLFDDVLKLDAMFGTGIQLGTAAGTQADVWWDRIKLWHVAKSTEVGGAGRSTDGVALLGYGFIGRSVWCKGGQRALYGNAGSDLQLGQLFAIGAHTGLWFNQSNQVAIGVVHLDSCGEVGGGYDGVVLDNAVSDVDLPSVKIFCVTGITRTLDNAINIGKTSTNKCIDIAIRANIQKTGGNAVALTNAQDFDVKAVVSNTASASSGGSNITTGAVYGSVAGSSRVELELNGTITPFSGTPAGALSYTRGGVQYFVQGNTTPTLAALTAAGTGAPTPTSVSPTNDARGTLQLGTGTGPSSGDQASVTFASGNAYVTAPRVLITALNAATSALQPYVKDAPTVSAFTVGFGVAPTASQSVGTYKLAYQVVG